MFEKLKQIKDLRSQAKTMQSVLATESVTAEKGGVTVTLNGNLEVTAFVIGDGMTKAQIEKASLEAVNEAVKKPRKLLLRKCKLWAVYLNLDFRFVNKIQCVSQFP